MSQALLIMLALCLMLLATYYAQNYAGIIGWSLSRVDARTHIMTFWMKGTLAFWFKNYCNFDKGAVTLKMHS